MEKGEASRNKAVSLPLAQASVTVAPWVARPLTPVLGSTCAPRSPTSLVAPFLPPLQIALNSKILADAAGVVFRAWAVSFLYVASFIITGGAVIAPS